MSTKIYTAWRTTLPRFRGVMLALHKHQFNSALKGVNKNLGFVSMDYINKRLMEIYNDGWQEKHTIEEFRAIWERPLATRISLALALSASKGSTRNKFDIDCGFNFWIRDNHAYIIPFGESRHVEGFEHPHAFDYHYQNSTDGPKHISKKAWAERSRNWNDILETFDAERMTHHVVSVKEDIGTYAIVMARHENDNARWHASGNYERELQAIIADGTIDLRW